MPEELVKQVPVLKKLIGDLGIKIVELEGYEADDIIGTLAKRFSCPTDIVTGDRDSLQLIDDTTNVLFTKRGITEVVRYDKERLFEDGFETPSAIIDYKALRGDASDNIPGIPGIGEKTAMELLKTYGTMENVLANADEIKGKLGEKNQGRKGYGAAFLHACDNKYRRADKYRNVGYYVFVSAFKKCEKRAYRAGIHVAYKAFRVYWRRSKTRRKRHFTGQNRIYNS